jgi:hypothetical protein
MSEIGVEPEYLILKQRDIEAWLGWSKAKVRAYRKSGALKGRKHGTSDFHYLKKDIKKEFNL